MSALHVGLIFLVTLLAAPRWLRVAQREHYEAGRVTAIAARWLRVVPVNQRFGAALLGVLALGVLLVAVGGVAVGGALAVLAVLASAFWPWGLAWRGKEKKLAFTPRARRLALAGLSLVLVLDAVALGLALASPVWVQALGVLLAGLVALGSPVVTDAACALATPVEKRLSAQWVTLAQKRFQEIHPTVVAITGSYGKTSTKNYAAHLIGPYKATVPSPASFNNLMGLSKAVNDRLTPGTDVFIAEMGTYGPGEIAALCELFPPDVSAITAIGDVHLERMGSRANIVKAKSEILVPARTVVLNLDSPELRAVADSQVSAGKEVWRVGTGPEATDVQVRPASGVETPGTVTVVVRGEDLGSWPVAPTVHPTNLAVAIALVSSLGVPPAIWLKRIGSIPEVPHRREVSTSPAGVTVIDDTYNANPDGALSALELGLRLADEQRGRLWVVTPGMIELGDREFEENQRLGEQVLARGASLMVVGYTNRAAFEAAVKRVVAEADGGLGRAEFLPDRPSAVKKVHEQARRGDVVLFENDLPDHYP
ncbi:Mur ligase family protein [Spongisporangium articulatum]|uniref:Mur ligase family protein n=1 Tax=Spongisporangium articulatum TaxID=3362603 RepID=A0ABW8AJ65_9ACTN